MGNGLEAKIVAMIVQVFPQNFESPWHSSYPAWFANWI